MFRTKTVLVIGAGASVEVGLPMGADLLKQIVNIIDIKFDWNRQIAGDHHILEALKLHLNEKGDVTKLNEHLQAARQLRQSASQALSIDNVIDALEDSKIELVGKIGIVRAILKAEGDSAPFKKINEQPETINLSKFNNTWYDSFTKLLTENVRKSQISSLFDNIEIVNFNYDRCLEYYLPLSLASYYGVHPDAIRDVMQGLKIHRPYGIAGRLPWQKGDGQSVEFGGGSPLQIASVAQEIRTFTERVEEASNLASMRASMALSERLIFLGFAFHRQNVELLAHKRERRPEIIATTYKISPNETKVIEREVNLAFTDKGGMRADHITLVDKTCAQLFSEHWRTLTA